jgi:hypothetical protein
MEKSGDKYEERISHRKNESQILKNFNPNIEHDGNPSFEFDD